MEGRVTTSPLIFLLIVSVIVGVSTYPGVILRHPETQTRPEGGTEKYVCTAQGDVAWYIDSQWLSYSYEHSLEGMGFTFSEARVDGTTFPTTNMTMTLPATTAQNGTKIQCKTIGSDGVTVSSTVAWLWIAVPPLPPNVSLELTSWNTIRLSWAPPFSMEGLPVQKYTVNTTNTTSGQRTRTDIYPPAGSGMLTHTILLDSPSSCHQLQFEVFAVNSVGNSAVGAASGGFPVALDEIEVDISVAFQQDDFTPHVTISFYLPDVCIHSGLYTKYIIEVKNSSGFLMMKSTEEIYQQSSSVLIEETVTLEASHSYTVNASVYVPSYAELGSFSVIKEFNTNIPTAETEETTSSTTTPSTEGPSTAATSTEATSTEASSNEGSATAKTSQKSKEFNLMTIIFIVVGVVGVVLLLIIVMGVAGCVFMFVMQRRKKQRRRRVDRPLPPMATNPIYDCGSSPVYDVIPEPQAAKPHSLQKQLSTHSLLSADSRYSSTPTTLPLLNGNASRKRAGTLSPMSPTTPSPREVDKLLRNTFTSTPSPLSQQHSSGGPPENRDLDSGDSGIYDTLSRMQNKGKEERDDCYVQMHSHML